ncbi:hypothetical protein ACQU6J_004775 [Escherichia coli]
MASNTIVVHNTDTD